MIGYCPLDDSEALVAAVAPARQQQQQRASPPPEKKFFNFLQGEDTECNYLVMFFILGVLILAATDSVSRSR
jgi:hypothetical protein